MAESSRITAYFSGYVHGVGFRFTTLSLAKRFPGISGYVRNLPDGRVELVAEGAKHTVQAFLDSVDAAMRSYVRSVDTVRGEATGEFDGFGIRR